MWERACCQSSVRGRDFSFGTAHPEGKKGHLQGKLTPIVIVPCPLAFIGIPNRSISLAETVMLKERVVQIQWEHRESFVICTRPVFVPFMDFRGADVSDMSIDVVPDRSDGRVSRRFPRILVSQCH
jgi:hypothetical protein